MKITKDKYEIKLPIDFELSKKYKEKFNHQAKQCYDNAFFLLTTGLIDTYVIGWVVSETVPIPIRHGFGIKDNKIVDTTLRLNDLGECHYYTMVELSAGDIVNLYDEFEKEGKELNTSLDGYIGYNVENKLQRDILRDLGYINK